MTGLLHRSVQGGARLYLRVEPLCLFLTKLPVPLWRHPRSCQRPVWALDFPLWNGPGGYRSAAATVSRSSAAASHRKDRGPMRSSRRAKAASTLLSAHRRVEVGRWAPTERGNTAADRHLESSAALGVERQRLREVIRASNGARQRSVRQGCEAGSGRNGGGRGATRCRPTKIAFRSAMIWSCLSEQPHAN